MLSTRVHDNLVFQLAIKRPWLFSFGVSISQSKICIFGQVSASFGFSKGRISAVFSCFGQSLPLPFVHTKKPDFYYLILNDHTDYTVFTVYTASTTSPASTAWTTTTTPTRAPTGLREGSGYQIGWIFGKIPNGLRPPPSPLIFGNLCCKFFMTDMK